MSARPPRRALSPAELHEATALPATCWKGCDAPALSGRASCERCAAQIDARGDELRRAAECDAEARAAEAVRVRL